jgi:hypothetical protein
MQQFTLPLKSRLFRANRQNEANRFIVASRHITVLYSVYRTELLNLLEYLLVQVQVHCVDNRVAMLQVAVLW